MSMTLSRPGQDNGAGDQNALFLKQFGGEVFTAFKRKVRFVPRHSVRSISSGYAASFPATWRNTAFYHVPGTEIDGNVMKTSERVIVIDDLLVSPVSIYRLDEVKNHWDARRPFTEACGEALANQYDRNVARVGVLAARASATVTGANGGTSIVSATSKTDADALIQAAFDAAEALDEKDVPEDGRFIALTPAQYYLLINSGSKLINRDFNDGNGSIAKGTVYSVAGLEIVKTNNLPTTNESADASIPAAYRGDFSTTTALVWHPSAMGTVKLVDLATEMEYSVRHQATLILAKYAIGHGVLRPECAVEIKTA